MLNMLWTIWALRGQSPAASQIAPLCRKGAAAEPSAAGVVSKSLRGVLRSARIGAFTNGASAPTLATFASRYWSGTGAFAQSAESTLALPTPSCAARVGPTGCAFSLNGSSRGSPATRCGMPITFCRLWKEEENATWEISALFVYSAIANKLSR